MNKWIQKKKQQPASSSTYFKMDRKQGNYKKIMQHILITKLTIYINTHIFKSKHF